VYTSADSVFQVATHVDVVPLDTLYEWCRIAAPCWTARIAWAGSSPGRSTGTPGAFVRTPDRRDFSVPPPGRPRWTV
jgi:phosphopentomutase